MPAFYWIIPPSGPVVPGEAIVGARPPYDALRALVLPLIQVGAPACRWIEHVAVLHDGRRASMFVDEDGHAHGLPFNPHATEIYHAASKARGQHVDDAPVIVGPAVLFDRNVWF